MFEHQHQGDGGKLTNHDIVYGGFNVEQNCKDLFMQLYTKPGGRCITTFFEPTFVRSV